MTSRPTVSIYDAESEKIDGSSTMPTVFSAPIRDDLVTFCHSNMALNRRQAHGVYHLAGHEHSAESWGTGRAVARIPRISGSGTHRSGQGAFGNMCRKGRMFAPLKLDDVPELPLVVDSLNKEKTAQLLKSLDNLGCAGDLTRVRSSKKLRAGQGKMRNSRFTLRKGPLIVYGDENPLVK